MIYETFTVALKQRIQWALKLLEHGTISYHFNVNVFGRHGLKDERKLFLTPLNSPWRVLSTVIFLIFQL